MSNITNLNRDYLIKINVKEATIDVPKMTFWNTDKKTSNMFVQLVINMSTNELISNYVTVQNATDYKITLNVIKPKTNQYRTIEATLLNEEKALFEIDLPDKFTDQVGDYSFEFEVSSKVDSNDESITTSNGTYKVNGSILTNLNEETSSSPDLPILKQLIEQVKSLQGGDLTGYQKKEDETLETTSKKVVGAINEVNSQYKDIAYKTEVVDGKLCLLKSDGTRIDKGTTLPISGSIPDTISILKTVNIGEIFEQPETYLAWFQGCMKYDEEIQCPVAVISGKDAHATGSGKCYFFKINPKDGEITLSVAGQYDDEDTYGCFSQSFHIDNDGNYNFYASIHQSSGWTEVSSRKYTSIDKDKTWTYTDVTGQNFPIGSIIKLKNGRLIGLKTNGSSVRGRAIYSDDNGKTWTDGFVFSGSTEVEIIELKDCLIAIGRKNLTYTNPLPAVLYFSVDNGENWTTGVESSTITDMCNSCSGIYWNKEDLLELFYCSRASNNGNSGTIYHAYAKLEDIKNDNFTVEKIGESKQTSVGQDFGYCSTACNQDEKAWIIYYDKADSGNGVNLNLILGDKTCVTLPISNVTNSLISLYSSKTIEDKINSLRRELTSKINEIIISGGGSVPDTGDGNMYITDSLSAYWDFTDGTNFDSSTGNLKSKVSKHNLFIANAYNSMDTPATINDFSTGIDKPMYIKHDNLITSNPGFSIEMTFKVNSVTGTVTFAGFNNSNGFYSNKNNMSDKSVVYNYLDTSSNTKGDTLWADGSLFKETGLTNIIITYGVEGIKIYRNGILNKSIDFTDLSSYDIGSYFIIRDGVKLSCRVYNKILTESEAKNNYTYEKNKYKG